jgi:hypothetical protein
MTVTPRVDVQRLRTAIQDEYAEVATAPEKGFHFHTANLVHGQATFFGMTRCGS